MKKAGQTVWKIRRPVMRLVASLIMRVVPMPAGMNETVKELVISNGARCISYTFNFVTTKRSERDIHTTVDLLSGIAGVAALGAGVFFGLSALHIGLLTLATMALCQSFRVGIVAAAVYRGDDVVDVPFSMFDVL